MILSNRTMWAGHYQALDIYKMRTYFIGNPEETRPLGRFGRRQEDNIKKGFK
jgi:hypothetical protein